VDDDDETPAQTEGPYFSPGSPERTDLREAGMGGTPLILAGFVYDTACRPIARALLDFWQADGDGRYDNSGFRLRGHQYTAADGSYRLSTIVPGLYTGRTRHIHVKAQQPNGPVLTTQLYFPGEARNAKDSIFNKALQLPGYRDQDGGKAGWFSFVLKG
jgi:protocatechuate 3,4-dioxygenase beta subunit